MDFSSTAEEDDNIDDDLDSRPQVDPLLHLQRPLKGIQLYVCCHGSRDTRCGKLGHSLVTVLTDLIRQHQLQDKMQVYKCSHVGGHKVSPSQPACSSATGSVSLVCLLKLYHLA